VDITTFCVVELCPLICKQSQVLFNKVLLRQTFYLDLLNNDFNHNTHVRMLLLFLLWFPELCPLTDQCQILFPFTSCFEIFTQFWLKNVPPLPVNINKDQQRNINQIWTPPVYCDKKKLCKNFKTCGKGKQNLALVS
jgi:hypothetical protein